MLMLFFSVTALQAQKPYRVGTTAANFLEIGFGGAGNAMGEAYVSAARDLSAIYWNPAGLAFMEQNEAQFFYQPWIADINISFAGVGIVLPNIGTLSLGVFSADYGTMDVTTVFQQEGTGDSFSSSDIAASLSFSRRLADWFAFGATAKYVSSNIWHSTARAFALDLGVLIDTQFLSVTGSKADGMSIGMSISNYGTRLKYDGIDLYNPIDILPNEAGNFRDTPGQFHLENWELPLIFRVGVSITPLIVGNQRLLITADALHPNNNSESVNLGGQYKLKLSSNSTFYLRGGYKALFMEESEFGVSAGGGMDLRLLNNLGLKLDYAYRGVGILGKTHSYSVGFLF
ncbi:MAG: hypothetical protein DWQ05_12085 [Calditrichaeota bacterium]|nr:MAG: hypothetical protein DWQ05_12085 [Calditrichota bacterium]